MDSALTDTLQCSVYCLKLALSFPRFPTCSTSSRQFLATPSEQGSRSQLQLSSLRGVVAFLPHNLPGDMSGMSDQPAFIDAIASDLSAIRLVKKPHIVFSVPTQDLSRLTLVPPNVGDAVKLIKGPWSGRKGTLISRHSTSSVVVLDGGEQLTIRNDLLGKYYGRQTSGFLAVTPNSSTSSSSTQAAKPVYSMPLQPSQQFPTPPSPCSSPSTPTSAYPPGYPSQPGYVPATSPQQPMANTPFMASQYRMLGLQMPCPPSYPTMSRYTHPQRSVPPQFSHGVLDLKQQLMSGQYKRPRPQQLVCSEKELKPKKTYSVEKVLELILKRPPPPAWRSSADVTSRCE